MDDIKNVDKNDGVMNLSNSDINNSKNGKNNSIK